MSVPSAQNQSLKLKPFMPKLNKNLDFVFRVSRNTKYIGKSLYYTKDFPFLLAVCLASAVTGLIFTVLIRLVTAQTWFSFISKHDAFLYITVALAAVTPIFVARHDIAETYSRNKEEYNLDCLRAYAPWRGDYNLDDFIAFAKNQCKRGLSFHDVIALMRQELVPLERQTVAIALLQLPVCMFDYMDNKFTKASVDDLLSVTPMGKQLVRMLTAKVNDMAVPEDVSLFVTKWTLRSFKTNLRLAVDNTAQF